MSISLQMPFKFKGGNAEPQLSVDNAQLVQTLHGKHYEDTLAGRVFSHTPTPAGLAIPIFTATALAGGMPIWNPSNSNVNVELISVSINRASGTAAVLSVGLMHRNNLGVDLATGSEITAFAETDPLNGLLGAGYASQVKSSNAGTVTVTAGVAAEFVRALFGSGIEADTHTNGISYLVHDFDGTVIVPPGSMVWLGAKLASVALYNSTIVWKEIPIR